jgi:hypothetical protein
MPVMMELKKECLFPGALLPEPGGVVVFCLEAAAN